MAAWGAIAAAAIGTLTGLGTTIYSEVKSKQANQQKINLLRSRTGAKLGEAEKYEALEGDFLKTALGKGYMETLKNNYRDALRATTQSGLKGGQSEEAKIAGRESAAKQYASGLSRLAQVGTQYRGQVLDNSMKMREEANKLAYEQGDAMLDQRKAQAANIASSGQSLGNAIGDIAGMAVDGTGSKQQKDLGGNKPETDAGKIVDEGTEVPETGLQPEGVQTAMVDDSYGLNSLLYDNIYNT
jgi:hypothetical protein